MGASVGGGDEEAAVSEINITPLVDVVLVLLIVFLITMKAVVTTASMEVNLPKSSSIAQSFDEPLVVSVVREGNGTAVAYLGDSDKVATPESIKAYLEDTGVDPADQRVTLSADEDLTHGDVIGVMDMLASAGLTKIAINTEHVER